MQASGEPTVYTVSDWVYRDLDKRLGDFRDKTLLSFDREHDHRGRRQTARTAATFKLVRGDDNQWHVDGQQGTRGRDGDQSVPRRPARSQRLRGRSPISPTDLAQFGLDQPLLALTVYGEAGKAIGTVLLAPRPGGEAKKEYTAMLEGGPTVFLVRDYLFTRLNKKADDFVDPADAHRRSRHAVSATRRRRSWRTKRPTTTATRTERRRPQALRQRDLRERREQRVDLRVRTDRDPQRVAQLRRGEVAHQHAALLERSIHARQRLPRATGQDEVRLARQHRESAARATPALRRARVARMRATLVCIHA